MVAWKKLEGMLAATLTPMHADGSINYDLIEPYINHLVKNVNGTAAEQMSLTLAEREKLHEHFVRLGAGKLDTIVAHCGASNLTDTKQLVAHAAKAGVQCVAVVMPTYFRARSIEAIVEYCAEAARAAPNTPFMYYHIPIITGLQFRLTDILRAMHTRIPTLIGAKFTHSDMADAGQSVMLYDGKYDIVVGAETMLTSAWAMGVRSAIGIAFSVLGRPCGRIIHNCVKSDYAAAAHDQHTVQEFWSQTHTPGDLNEMIAAFKFTMSRFGMDFGAPRLPILPLRAEQKAAITKNLDALKLESWIGQK